MTAPQRFVDEETNPMLILVDEIGTAFIVISPPSSTDKDGHKARTKLGSALTLQRCCTPQNKDDVEKNQNEKNAREDEKILEEAILKRKSQLEKSAEERAEGIFKLWYKETKTLEQVIDESLRDHVEMCEKAHALRLQFNHEKSSWMAKIRQEALDNREDAAANRGTHRYTRNEYIKNEPERENESEMEISTLNGSQNYVDKSEKEETNFIYDLSDDILHESELIDLKENKKRIQPSSLEGDKEVVSKKMKKFSTPSKAISSGSHDNTGNASITCVPRSLQVNIENISNHANIPTANATAATTMINSDLQLSSVAENTTTTAMINSDLHLSSVAQTTVNIAMVNSELHLSSVTEPIATIGMVNSDSHLTSVAEIIATTTIVSSDLHSCSVVDDNSTSSLNSRGWEAKGGDEDRILEIKDFLPENICDIRHSPITSDCNINLSNTLNGEDLDSVKENELHLDQFIANCMVASDTNMAIDSTTDTTWDDSMAPRVLESVIDSITSPTKNTSSDNITKCLIVDFQATPCPMLTPFLSNENIKKGSNNDAANISIKDFTPPPLSQVKGQTSDITINNVLMVNQSDAIATITMIDSELHPCSFSNDFSSSSYDNTFDCMRDWNTVPPTEHRSQEESFMILQDIHDNHQQFSPDSESKEEVLRSNEFIANCETISDSPHVSTCNDLDDAEKIVFENALEIVLSTTINPSSAPLSQIKGETSDTAINNILTLNQSQEEFPVALQDIHEIVLENTMEIVSSPTINPSSDDMTTCSVADTRGINRSQYTAPYAPFTLLLLCNSAHNITPLV